MAVQILKASEDYLETMLMMQTKQDMCALWT